MRRREFLSGCSGLMVSMLGSGTPAFGKEPAPSGDSLRAMLQDMMIIDAHAHPDEFYTDRYPKDLSSSVQSITELGMNACVFSALGDRSRDMWEESFPGIMTQLAAAMRYVQSGKAKLVLQFSDIPLNSRKEAPGCILGIERANPLQRDLGYFDEVYRYGVRIITLGHYQINDFTDIMTTAPRHGGLSPLGKKAVQKMETLGIVIDVAHASSAAIRDIAGATKRPLIDSHTSVCHIDTLPCSRFRTWKEMELIAKTGGVVCTWPMARRKEGYRRVTFLDWATEILEMKKRIGMEHVGLGTDGGGHLPAVINGYEDVRDLPKLAAAMREVGLKQEEIAAYMGGNFLRVFKAYTG